MDYEEAEREHKCQLCGERFGPHDSVAEMAREDSTDIDEHVLCHYECGQEKGMVLA